MKVEIKKSVILQAGKTGAFLGIFIGFVLGTGMAIAIDGTIIEKMLTFFLAFVGWGLSWGSSLFFIGLIIGVFKKQKLYSNISAGRICLACDKFQLGQCMFYKKTLPNDPGNWWCKFFIAIKSLL